MHGINSKQKGIVLLAVIAFVILTAIIAEAFLIYFYNQYRITLQKIIYEKAFYFALSGIEWAKVKIKAGEFPSGRWVEFTNWGSVPYPPEINLRYMHDRTKEYPDLPYNFKLVIRRDGERGVISYCESEISSGSEKVFAARRIEVTLKDPDNPDPIARDVSELNWMERSLTGTSEDVKIGGSPL